VTVWEQVLAKIDAHARDLENLRSRFGRLEEKIDRLLEARGQEQQQAPQPPPVTAPAAAPKAPKPQA